MSFSPCLIQILIYLFATGGYGGGGGGGYEDRSGGGGGGGYDNRY